jgi:transcription initiation factor IIF auxiliary subunit
MTNKRKSLTADVMQQFMKDPDAVSNSVSTEFSTDKLVEVNTEVSADPLESIEESSLTADVIEMFKSNQKEATTRFTVDLPKSRHQRFAIVSKQLNTNMSSLARVLIEKFLDEVERDKLL